MERKSGMAFQFGIGSVNGSALLPNKLAQRGRYTPPLQISKQCHRARAVYMTSQNNASENLLNLNDEHSLPAVSDVLVIGGGMMGLASAVEMAKHGAKVTVVSRDWKESAAVAAAGMLAPQSEQLEEGKLLDLCLLSRAMYPEWVQWLESLPNAQSVHYRARGDFLLPAIRGVNEQEVRDFRPPTSGGPATWLEGKQGIAAVDPKLAGDHVTGAWWFPMDGAVDNSALHAALINACHQLGVKIVHNETVVGLEVSTASWKERNNSTILSSTSGQRVHGLVLSSGRTLAADHILVANGAWVRDLLALPVRPIKGQMMCLRPVNESYSSSSRLRSVIFSPGCYLVPRDDGRIIVGATSEDVGFHSKVTAQGILSLLQKTINLVPELAEYEVASTWAGYRPTTPDLLPIIGHVSHYQNVTVATGHHRNGILLTPVTAKMVASLVLGVAASESVGLLIPQFGPDRFFGSVVSAPPSTKTRTIPAIQPLTAATAAAPTVKETKKPVFQMWQINSDGTETPIDYKKPPPTLTGDYGDTTGVANVPSSSSSSSPSSSPSQPSYSSSPVAVSPQAYINGEPRKNFMSATGVMVKQPSTPSVAQPVATPDSSNIAFSNDAYDDLMRFRGTDMEKTMSESLSKNRSFGNIGGLAGSSLGSEELEFLDQVYDESLKEAYDFIAKMDDKSDPGYIASMEERRKMGNASDGTTFSSNGYF